MKKLFLALFLIATLSGCSTVSQALKPKDKLENPTMLATVGKSIDVVLSKNKLRSEKTLFGNYKFYRYSCKDTGYVVTRQRGFNQQFESYKERVCGSVTFTTDSNQIITSYKEEGYPVPELVPVTSLFVAQAVDLHHPEHAAALSKSYPNRSTATSEAIALCVEKGGRESNCRKTVRVVENECAAVIGAYRDGRVIASYLYTDYNKSRAKENGKVSCRKKYLGSASCKVLETSCAY